MHHITCDNSHATEVLAIFNDVITTSTALYDYAPRTPPMVDAWFDAKRAGGWPILGVAADDGGLMGFASYGTFRGFPAYKYTVEHSLYVASACRGHGVGRMLLEALIAHARREQYHVMVGAIDAANTASIRLHERFGFTRTGLLPQVGFKFGRWLDLVLYQLTLDTPTKPVDG